MSFHVSCTSPASDWSSSRPPFGFPRAARSRRTSAPSRPAPTSAPEGKSLFVKVIRAVTPSGFAAASESCAACASGFGGGVDPPPPLRGDGDDRAADERRCTRRLQARSGGWSRACGGSSRRTFLVALARPGLPSFSEAFLRAGSSIVNREPLDERPAAVPLRGRPDDREAEPRAAAVRPRAPEPLEHGRSSPCAGPGPSSSTSSSARPSVARTATLIRPPGGPCRRAFSTRFESARSSAGRSPSTQTGSAVTSTPGAATTFARARRDRLSWPCARGARFLPRQREQVVGEPSEALGVRLEIGDQVRRRAVAREVRDVPAQRGQRRAELVRGVGEEPPLGLARPLEAVEHRVQRRREPADLVVAVGSRQAPARVAGALDLARAARRA